MTTAYLAAQAIAGGIYAHRKGGIYRVEDIALESTNGRERERVVVYLGTEGLNVRTEREFLEMVDGEPRFRLIRTTDSRDPSFPQTLPRAQPAVSRADAELSFREALAQQVMGHCISHGATADLQSLLIKTVLNYSPPCHGADAEPSADAPLDALREALNDIEHTSQRVAALAAAPRDEQPEWLSPECQHSISRLLRLSYGHIPSAAVAFRRDLIAAAEHLDAFPAAGPIQ